MSTELQKVWLLQAEHPIVPGIITRVFGSQAAADAYREKEVLGEAYEGKFTALQDEHGAEHCWVEITEHEVHV